MRNIVVQITATINICADDGMEVEDVLDELEIVTEYNSFNVGDFEITDSKVIDSK